MDDWMYTFTFCGPPLWSSGQSSEFLAADADVLGFYLQLYQIFCIAVCLERNPLKLVKINEELLERKVAVPV
jgi:hypothetical protein